MPHNFHPFPQLTTDRLILRKATTDDLDSIFFLRSDSEVMKYINRPAVKTMDEARAFLQKINGETKGNESLFWAIALKSDGAMIGAISLWHFSDDLQTAEIGYSLHPEFQNRGIMTEAMEAVLIFGFKRLHFQTIEAFTNRWNEASKRMLLKTGFTLLPDRIDEGDANNSIYELEADEFDLHQKK